MEMWSLQAIAEESYALSVDVEPAGVAHILGQDGDWQRPLRTFW